MSDLIERYGYERAVRELKAMDDRAIWMISSCLKYREEVRKECLEYRREHNIFEVRDKVVSINSAFIEYQGILNIDFIDKFNLMLSDGCKGFEVNAICGWSKIIRHATDAEIEAGRRL